MNIGTAGPRINYRVYQPSAVEIAAGHVACRYYWRPLGDQGHTPHSTPYETCVEAVRAVLSAGSGAAVVDSRPSPTPTKITRPEPADRYIISLEAQALLADDDNLW